MIAKLKHWLHQEVLIGGALGAATLILFACNTTVLAPTDLNATQPLHSTSPIEPAPANAVAQPELPQIPSSLELASEDAVGERLVISGTVYADDQDTPLANAFITIWHTDAEGEYGQFHGTLQSDATGVYQFRTIRPGNYQVETTIRAAHIHFNINAVGMQSASGEILFADDPYLETDPVVLEMDPAVDTSRVITLTLVEEPAGSYFQGQFDVILKSR
jgi:protocatechuate 3,4-dioxygenase beta subunit